MMDYNKTRAEAERRKAELLKRQQQIPLDKQKLDGEMEQIKRQLIGIEQILDGLAFMDSDVFPDYEPTGFTDSIRKILSETNLPLVPMQIRDALEAKGITGSSSKNLLINVHKVLERIEAELEKTTNLEGKTAYKRKAAWMMGLGFYPLQTTTTETKPSPQVDAKAREAMARKTRPHFIPRRRPRTVPPPPGSPDLTALPNPFATTLGGMLKEPEKKK